MLGSPARCMPPVRNHTCVCARMRAFCARRGQVRGPPKPHRLCEPALQPRPRAPHHRPHLLRTQGALLADTGGGECTHRASWPCLGSSWVLPLRAAPVVQRRGRPGWRATTVGWAHAAGKQASRRKAWAVGSCLGNPPFAAALTARQDQVEVVELCLLNEGSSAAARKIPLPR